MGKWTGALACAAAVTVAGAGAAGAADSPVAPKMDMGVTCTPAGTSLALTADGHKFDKGCLAVPAGQSFTIRFDNRDGDRHNIAILPSHTATATFFEGDIVAGPRSVTYQVPALKPGTFHFHCEVHPNLMNGVFIVGLPSASGAAPVAKPGPTTTTAPMAGAAAPRASAGAAATAEPSAGPAGPAAPVPDSPAPMPAAPMPRSAAATPGRTAASAAAPATSPLPRTGSGQERRLLLAAGLALAGGGLSVLTGAARRSPKKL
ncbi:MAG TPA: cupredoxin domain-containing protein [Acidimicrobiia bacterium]|nr:cupredoxin domain-containing protein [Acidimicrobiia bacterium]